MVASRCAITKVVRPFITSSSAACTLASVSASSALVASSRIRIGGSLSSARAIESALALAARQHAGRARRHWLSKPSRIALDDVERLRARAGVAHLRLGGVGLADPQIVGDRAVEQQRLLEHHADVAAQPRQRERRGCPCRRSSPRPIADRRRGAAARAPSTCRRRSAPTSAMVSPGSAVKFRSGDRRPLAVIGEARRP